MDKIKVLLIEDDENARKQLIKVIQKEGFEVVMAKDGKQGLESYDTEKPDIVITDLKMPNIDGMEVMHTVKRLTPHVPVIIITAFGEIDDSIAALREGVLDYLKKPLDINELLLALGRAKEKVLEAKNTFPYPAILLAEDDDSTGERLTRVLQKEKWNLFWVKDGEEALRVFQHQKIDIALLDIKMPKKDGLQTLHEMKAISTDFEAIILTGYGDESNAVQALRDGAHNFIRKPIELDELIVSIEKALEKLKMTRALKHRTRELALAEQIIAKITSQREIILDFGNPEHIHARAYAQEVLDCLPICLVVFDEKMNVRFINLHLSKAIQYVPEKVDEKFVNALTKAGIPDMSMKVFNETADCIFKKESGALDTVKTGSYSYLNFVGLYLLERNIKEKVVMVAVRGERT